MPDTKVIKCKLKFRQFAKFRLVIAIPLAWCEKINLLVCLTSTEEQTWKKAFLAFNRTHDLEPQVSTCLKEKTENAYGNDIVDTNEVSPLSTRSYELN